MSEAISKIIPIILLVSLGYLIQRHRWATDDQMGKIRLGIIMLALPAVLFTTFMRMELKKEQALVTALFFLIMCLAFVAGRLVSRPMKKYGDLVPFMCTGMTFGVLGIPLYAAVYGVENLGQVSQFAIGHESFIWFIYVTMLKKDFNGEPFGIKTMGNFIRSPLILSILAGVAANMLGVDELCRHNAIFKGISHTLDSLGGLTTPLIFIVTGYGIQLERAYVKPAVKLLLIRYAVLFSVAYLVKFLIMDRVIGEVTPLYNRAFFTYMILPPPYSSAIFISLYSTPENTYVTNNVLVLSTVMAVTVMSLAALVVPL